LLGYSPSHCI